MAASIPRNVMLIQKGLRRGTAFASIAPVTAMAWQQVRMQTTKPTLKVIKPESAQQELARQRLRRPVSPHLAIYKWQVHSISSAMERNTGLLLAGGLYLFGTSYLVGPWLGWDVSSAALVTAFGALPLAAKVVIKFCVAWPVTFHVFSGIRYVVASTARTLESKSQVIKIAWAVIGTSAFVAAGLVAYV
ncbi:hypothetical protein EYZ11_003090 [Aspergillus tanneri]|uniref:Cytochrome b subunit of succinate dehydrogenase, Sdh3p n=1 Tax=Aspergillus tanneri TaxID=1220188 RepID=A0A4S3JTV2_9EURO|nr:hypothetical protein EYZ11_003090 [Aspergillus tanneri]